MGSAYVLAMNGIGNHISTNAKYKTTLRDYDIGQKGSDIQAGPPHDQASNMKQITTIATVGGRMMGYKERHWKCLTKQLQQHQQKTEPENSKI
eukprot:4639296-Ditylum_brightwellii.AAC.2